MRFKLRLNLGYLTRQYMEIVLIDPLDILAATIIVIFPPYKKQMTQLPLKGIMSVREELK